MSETKRKVPKLRFPGFTEDWEQCKLGDMGETFTGLTGKTKEDFGHGEARYITYLNVFQNTMSDLTMVDSVEIDKTQNEVCYGDILFTTSSETPEEVGMTSVWLGTDDNTYLNSFCFGYRLSVEVDLYFMGYLLRSPSVREQMKILAQGISRYNISKNKVMEIEVYIPTKVEQTMIGQFLHQLDNSITLHQRKLENLKLKKKALLQKLFPKNGEQFPELRFPGFTDAWEQRKLGDLAKVEMDKRIYKEQTSAEGEIPFYKIGTFGGKADSYISEDLYNEYTRKYPHPKEGDILISASGSIGRTVVYHGEKAYFQDSNIVWLNHNGALDNGFLLQFYSRVKWAGLEGSTIKRLYNKNILETEINVPDIREQKNIGEFFTQVDNLITLHQRKLEHLQLQKKALLQQMFV